MKRLTYDAWKAAGYYVRRGEQASYDKDGNAVFSRDQVEEQDSFDRGNNLKWEN